MQRYAEHFLGVVFFHRKATRYWSVTMDASRYYNRFVTDAIKRDDPNQLILCE